MPRSGCSALHGMNPNASQSWNETTKKQLYIPFKKIQVIWPSVAYLASFSASANIPWKNNLQKITVEAYEAYGEELVLKNKLSRSSYFFLTFNDVLSDFSQNLFPKTPKNLYIHT